MPESRANKEGPSTGCALDENVAARRFVDVRGRVRDLWRVLRDGRTAALQFVCAY
jgi:hypothetical protein